ncbi:hypothetical protein [Paraoerskovia marina]|uniref:hypothetical protein n=1 Tax=Paraoerskovia marina TaxID=545619 RepID=UPI000492DE67|nr:hypothetical protein [Paraoerskovia marina]
MRSYLTKQNVVIASLVLVALIAAIGWIATANMERATAQRSQTNFDAWEQSQADLESAEETIAEQDDTIDDLEQEVADSVEAAAAVSTRSDSLDQREDELDTALKDIEARESALEEGEEKLKADQEKAALPAWYNEVKKCLERGGDYVSATVSDTSYTSLDTSCYNG